MNTAEKVQALMVGEEHVRHEESKQWAVKYRTALMELAVELDAANAKIFALEHANPDQWKDNLKGGGSNVHGSAVDVVTGAAHPNNAVLSKSEATSKRMKEYWAKRKGLTK